MALSEQEKYSEAIKCYDQAIYIEPTYFNAWNNKGIYILNSRFGIKRIKVILRINVLL